MLASIAGRELEERNEWGENSSDSSFVKVASSYIIESAGVRLRNHNGPQTALNSARAKCALVIMMGGEGEKNRK